MDSNRVPIIFTRYVHIDVKYLPQMADERARRYVFVAIDRATRWVFISIKAQRTAATARSFLNGLAKAAPSISAPS